MASGRLGLGSEAVACNHFRLARSSNRTYWSGVSLEYKHICVIDRDVDVRTYGETNDRLKRHSLASDQY